MEEKTNPEVKEEKILTPEEIKEAQDKTIVFYTRQCEVLRSQAEYAKLAAEIEEYGLRRTLARIRHAELLYGPGDQEPPAPDGTGNPPTGEVHPGTIVDPNLRPSRKLRTDPS
jgi:hypothetical protein